MIGKARLDGGWVRLLGPGHLPGRRCWQSPGRAAGRPPWPPQCPNSGRIQSPTQGTHFSLLVPPLGPRRGCGLRSDVAVDSKKHGHEDGWKSLPILPLAPSQAVQSDHLWIQTILERVPPCVKLCQHELSEVSPRCLDPILNTTLLVM